MNFIETLQTYISGTFPDTIAVDSSGAATQDGTEYIAAQLNNSVFGPQQAIMNYAGLTPDGVTEADGTAQILEALNLGWAIGPGMGVTWWLNDLPSVTGHRVLMLEGQGVLVASYPLLDAAVWCTDAGPGGSPASGYNAIVAAGGGAYYRASDAAGTTPNIAGPYLILPDTRGYALRGLDLAAAVDPDGASRYLGDMQGFDTETLAAQIGISGNDIRFNLRSLSFTYDNVISGGTNTATTGSENTGTVVSSTGSGESRMTNISTKYGITY